MCSLSHQMEEVLLTQKVYSSTRTSSMNLYPTVTPFFFICISHYITLLLNLLLLQELNHMLHCTTTTILSLSRMSMEDGLTAELCRLLKVPFT